MATSTRFPNLVVPQICTTDPAQIATERIVEYEADFLAAQGVAKVLAPGDPVRIIELREAARESQFRSLINYAYGENFILTATGDDLDAIGSNYGDRGLRLPASYALTTIQFSIAGAITSNVAIPINTMVATGSGVTSNVFFITTQPSLIPTGQTSVLVPAQCTVVGAVGNGYTVGQISQLVNYSLPFVVTVSNTTETQGGADRESDDAYAYRLSLVPGSFSVAGPRGAYEYWGYTANTAISDVSIITPDTTPSVAAGNINVCVLLQGGVIPNSTVLAQVASVFKGDIVPLGDLVTVIAPTPTTYNVSLTYYIDPINSTLQLQIQSAVAKAVLTFNTWVSAKIGRSLNVDYLIQLIMEAGASYVTVTLPAYTQLDAVHVGIQSGTMVLNFGGFRAE